MNELEVLLIVYCYVSLEDVTPKQDILEYRLSTPLSTQSMDDKAYPCIQKVSTADIRVASIMSPSTGEDDMRDISLSTTSNMTNTQFLAEFLKSLQQNVDNDTECQSTEPHVSPEINIGQHMFGNRLIEPILSNNKDYVTQPILSDNNNHGSTQAMPSDNDKHGSTQAMPSDNDNHSSTQAMPSDIDNHGSTQAMPSDIDNHSSTQAMPSDNDNHGSTQAMPSDNNNHGSTQAMPSDIDNHSSTQAMPSDNDNHASTEAMPSDNDNHGSTQAMPSDNDNHGSTQAMPSDNDNHGSTQAMPSDNDNPDFTQAMPSDNDIDSDTRSATVQSQPGHVQQSPSTVLASCAISASNQASPYPPIKSPTTPASPGSCLDIMPCPTGHSNKRDNSGSPHHSSLCSLMAGPSITHKAPRIDVDPVSEQSRIGWAAPPCTDHSMASIVTSVDSMSIEDEGTQIIYSLTNVKPFLR